MQSFFTELKWRGLIHNHVPGVDDVLASKKIAGYIGFDPTADSLHIGNLVQIMTLLFFQQTGNKPIVLVGGATGLVGDPSGKTKERALLSHEQLQHNLNAIKKQLEKFLNFESGDNRAEVVNNYDWFKEYRFLDFIRDVGKHITVNYMLAKDSVQNRLESGMSFTEFSYQLVQGYDFYWLNEHKNCMLQMGGSDQWGNMVTGMELIRRMGDREAYVITTPLITKADGSKFGKSEKGNVWLDAEKTSPYHFYQYWLNVADEDAKNFIKIFTLHTQAEIEKLIEQHDAAPHERLLQKELAREITARVHSAEECQQAIQASEILFGKAVTDALKQIPEKMFLNMMDGVPVIKISPAVFQQANMIDFLSIETKNELFPSKGEARKMLQAGGVSINKKKITDTDLPSSFEKLHGQYLLVQKGKKNYFLLQLAD